MTGTPSTRKNTHGRNPAITLLRVILWLLPSVMVPLSIILPIALLGGQIGGLISVFLPLCVILGLGWFDNNLRLQQRLLPQNTEDTSTFPWIVRYLLLQTLLIPVTGGSMLLALFIINPPF